VSIEIERVSKAFGAFRALDDVSLSVPGGALVALLGPSGSGKTTLLRTIAGLESPDRGTVRLDGQDVTDRHPRERGVGFVFQHYALFRHLSVFENVAFGLRVRPRRARPAEAAVRARVAELLDLVQLPGLVGRYPHQLSGGQRQRVALARALATEPKVLLLDEPFGALDARVRQELRRWLRRLHDRLAITGVLVTHDQEEALEVADEVVVLRGGRIEQAGTPQAVYDRPASPFVYAFLGHANRFPARVHRGRAAAAGQDLAVPEYAAVEDHPATAYARPHELQLLPTAGATHGPSGPLARITAVRFVGPVARLQLRRLEDGGALEAELDATAFRGLALAAGDDVRVTPRRLRVFLGAEGRPPGPLT
jgi:sulfate transport system ATP-binding protein